MYRFLFLFCLLVSPVAYAEEPSEYLHLENAIGVQKIRVTAYDYYSSYYKNFGDVGHTNKRDPASGFKSQLKKKYKKFEAQVNNTFKHLRDNQKHESYNKTRQEMLDGGRFNMIDNAFVHLNNIVLEEEVSVINKHVGRVLKDSKLNNKYRRGLVDAMYYDPYKFKNKTNFRIQKEVSPNVAWLTYDLLNNDGGTTATGNALVFSKKLSAISNMAYPESPVTVEWIGLTLPEDGKHHISANPKYSISDKLNYGNNKETVIEGLKEKFKFQKKDMEITRDCIVPAGIGKLMVQKTPIKTKASINKKVKLQPFLSLSRMITWVGTDNTLKIVRKNSNLFEFESCTESITGYLNNDKFSATFLPDHGLVRLLVKRRIEKEVSADLFIKNAEKNWGSKYIKTESNLGVSVEYPGLKVKKSSSAGRTRISYVMDTKVGDKIMYWEFYNRVSGKKIGKFVADPSLGLLMSDFPYRLLKVAPSIEKVLMEMYEVKKTKTATSFDL